MNKIMLVAIGLSLASASIAQAQPHHPGRGPPGALAPQQDRDMRHDDRDTRHDERGDRHGGRGDGWRHRHHGKKVCFWRHHERICHWRHW